MQAAGGSPTHLIYRALCEGDLWAMTRSWDCEEGRASREGTVVTCLHSAGWPRVPATIPAQGPRVLAPPSPILPGPDLSGLSELGDPRAH